MEYFNREEIINGLQQPLQTYINKYGIDDIGIFEEEGRDDQYYIGYTASKGGKTYHIHAPYKKNPDGRLAPVKNEWTVETDEPNGEERHGYQDVESAFREIQ